MPSTIFTIRVESDVNEWQVAGVKRAMASLDQGGGVAHEDVKSWVSSWGSRRERRQPQ